MTGARGFAWNTNNSAGPGSASPREWLELGFGRIFDTPPTTPGSNAVNPNAILILAATSPNTGVAAAHGAGTAGNWYPINFYDAREGEMRDNVTANTTSGNKFILPARSGHHERR